MKHISNLVTRNCREHAVLKLSRVTFEKKDLQILDISQKKNYKKASKCSKSLINDGRKKFKFSQAYFMAYIITSHDT